MMLCNPTNEHIKTKDTLLQEILVAATTAMQTTQVSRSTITHLVGTTAVLFGGHDVASSWKNRVAGTAPAMCARPSILLLPGVNAPVGHVDLLPSLTLQQQPSAHA